MPILSTSQFIQKLNDILFVDPETGNYIRDPYHVKDYLTARLLMQQIVEYSEATDTFLELTDTPSSYSGQANKMVVVNGGESALVFVDVPGPSVITNVIAGNRIATHSDGDGTSVEIDETITGITDNTDGTWDYSKEGGGTDTIDIRSYVTSQLPNDLELQNTLIVAKNGNDSTGTRNNWELPYLTISAAITDASAGDTIIVMPGSYTENLSVSTNISFHFFPNTLLLGDFLCSTMSNCAITGALRIDNTSSGVSYAFDFLSCSNCTAELDRVTSDFSIAGIRIDSGSGNIVKVNEFIAATGSGMAFELDESNDSKIECGYALFEDDLARIRNGNHTFICNQAVWNGAGDGDGIEVINTDSVNDSSRYGVYIKANIEGDTKLLYIDGDLDIMFSGYLSGLGDGALVDLIGSGITSAEKMPRVVINNTTITGENSTGGIIRIGEDGSLNSIRAKLRMNDCTVELDNTDAGKYLIEFEDNSSSTVSGDLLVQLKNFVGINGQYSFASSSGTATPNIELLNDAWCRTGTDGSVTTSIGTLNTSASLTNKLTLILPYNN